MSKLSEHEIQILKAVGGVTSWPDWGSWVGACLEFLQNDGFVTRGSTPRLTDRGRKVLKELI